MTDLSGTLGRELDATLAKARQFEAAGEVKEARQSYLKASEIALRYAQSSPTAAVRKQRLERAKSLRTKADQVEKAATRSPEKAGPGGQGDDEGANADREQARRLIARSTVRWEDIAGLDDLKRELITEYAKGVAKAPSGVKLRPRRTMLLFGPPGTGKTLFASAISTGLEATFFNVRTGDVLSSYFGKSPQLVAALFEEAAARQPSVVFFDEIEALVPSRDRDISGAESRVVTAFLQMIDGFRTEAEAPLVLIVAATNKPWQLDDAMLSRFNVQVYVPLPDGRARARIFELNLDGKGIRHDLSLAELARLSEGYSGREIAAICDDAISAAIHASNPELEGVAQRGLAALKDHQLRLEPVGAEYFHKALARRAPAADSAAIRRYEEWRKKAEG